MQIIYTNIKIPKSTIITIFMLSVKCIAFEYFLAIKDFTD